MPEVGSLFIRLRADASEFSETMAGVSGQFNTAGKGMKDAGGKVTKNITAPLLGLAGAALAVGVGFDDQMAKVSAISGATGDDFNLLRGTAQELGSTTRFSAREAAEGLEYLALAGWDANEMADGLGGVLSLASAAGMDLGRTSDIVTDTMSAFGISAEDSGKVADMFATTSSSANTNVEQLGGALAKAGPTLAAMGLGLDDTQAALGLMADQGLKGSRAGTALSAVMSDMAANAEDGVVSFGDFDVALYNADGSMRDFGDILGDLEGGLEGMSDEQRRAALSSVFQRQAMDGINPLLAEGSDRYEELRDSINDSEGASARMSETMEDTLGGSLRGVKSAMEGVLIQLSDVLTPIIQEQVIPLVQRFAEFLSDLIDRFSNLSPGMQGIILGALGLAAALGPMLMVLGGVVMLIGAALSPIGLIVAAIALLAAGLVIAYTQSETFRDIVHGIWDFLKAAAELIFPLILDFIQSAWEGIQAVTDAVWPVIQSVIETVSDVIQSVVEAVWPVIQSIVETVSEAVLGIIEMAWPKIQDIIETVAAIVEEVISLAWGAIQSATETVWPVIEAVIDGVMGVIQGIIETVTGIMQSVWEATGDSILGTAETVWGAIETVIENTLDTIQGILDTVLAVLQGDWEAAWEAIKGVLETVWDTIETIIETALEIIQTYIEVGWETIKTLFETAWGLIETTVSDGVDAVVEFMQDLPGKILEAIGDLGSLLLDAGSDLIGGLISGITGKLGDLKDSLGGVTDLIPDWKGPPERDEKLLEPAGNLIMQGLAEGIGDGTRSVMNRLQGLTGDIGRFNVDPNVTGAASQNTRDYAGGRQIIIHNEIDGEVFERMIVNTLTGQMEKVY